MRPAAGVWCSRCLTKGHKCQAQMYEENVPLCLYCADDVPCSVDRVGPPQAPEMYEPERGMPDPPQPTPAMQWNGRTTKEPRVHQRAEVEVRVAPAVKEAMLAYPDGTAYAKIAREQGVAEHLAVAIRKNAGFRGAPRVGRAGNPKKPETKVIAGEPVVMTSGVVMGPEMIAPERRDEVKDLEQEILQHAGKMTDDDVARKVGCSSQRVHQIRKKHGVAPWKGRQPIPIELRRAIAADVMTMPIKGVAKKHRVAVGTVATVVKEEGIVRPDMRGRAGFRKATAMVVAKPEQRTIEIDASKPAAVDRLIDTSENGSARVRMRVASVEVEMDGLSAEQAGKMLRTLFGIAGLRG